MINSPGVGVLNVDLYLMDKLLNFPKFQSHFLQRNLVENISGLSITFC